ncbi:MAG: type II toxin-antitoxin system Phd/YefM family antitoxin [Planctomycetes bacterium]|nr:type II toxin-antitoxin system Phd/YefM family antitoxin [Planctomycetota bacterium]
MNTHARHISAGEFKAKCLALLDEVANTGDTIVVTKRGRPVAKVVPVKELESHRLLGSVLREEDIISPIDANWNAAL